MIATLRGQLTQKGSDSLVVEVGGVGYEVFFSAGRQDRLPARGEELFLHIQTVVREDSFCLYGFVDAGEKQFFQLLLGVSGVGPRLAMNILAAAAPDILSRAIAADDVAGLKKLPGVGKKTAERLCLELKDKVDFFPAAETLARPAQAPPAEPGADFSAQPLFQDAYSALLNLGYPPARARGALEETRRQLGPEQAGETPLPELLRLTLRSLA
ncbi:MAG: Holliday junction branch migration protein RuvA [Desulfurivibrio sp.]|nr:Holliday junction branch migration protein RuvA [Desulfurivibrio sp.]